MPETNLVTVDNVPNVEIAKKQWDAYQELCQSILEDSDFQKIIVKEKDETGKYVSVEREFKKKSAWQKLGRAFNVDTSIVEKEFQRTKMGRINEAYYCVRATLPNGRSVESDALCSRSEKGKQNVSDHTIMATAKTRATNRAISELIGAGEVSSDEMTAEYKAAENHYISANETSSEEKGFITADVVGEPDSSNDPIKSQCYMVKDMLEAEGKPVTKQSMKIKVVQLAKEQDSPIESKHALLDYIAKHCPEELE